MKSLLFVTFCMLMMFLTRTPTFGQLDPTELTCPEAPPSRLNVGMQAFVAVPVQSGDERRDLRVRAEPGGEQVGSMAPGTEFVITGSAVCGEDGLMWWPVETLDSSLEGWSVEGFAPDDYLMIPILEQDASEPQLLGDEQPTSEAATDPCFASPPTRLEPPAWITVYMKAYASLPAEGEPRRDLRVRDEPGGEQIGSMAAGTLIAITGEAVCDSDGLRWWPVATLDGTLEGWSAEGFAPDDYFISPITLNRRETITLSNAHRLIEMDTVALWIEFPDEQPSTRIPAFSPDGSLLASDGPLMQLWDTMTGEEITTFSEGAHRVIFSPDGKYLALVSSRGVSLFDMEGNKIRTFEVGIDGPIVFSPDGTLLAVAEEYYRDVVRLYDVETGERPTTINQGTQEPVRGIVFSPDGDVLAVSSGNVGTYISNNEPIVQNIRLWDVNEAIEVGDFEVGDEQFAWEIGTDGVGNLAFSPNGELLVIETDTFEDRVLEFWDVETITQRSNLRGETSPVFNPDGTILATLTRRDFRVLRLWNIELGGELGAFGEVTDHPHAPIPVSIAYSPDGTLIAVGWSGGRGISLWGVPIID